MLVKLGKYTFSTGVVPANMKSVISRQTALFLAERKWFYIMHRFDVNNYEFTEDGELA